MPILDWLFAERHICLTRGAVFDLVPRAPDTAGLADRVEGMLLGLAIGDSLGNSTEATNPGERAARHGEIRDYLPHKWAGGQAIGVPSDDTQLAFWTLEHLLERDGGLDPEALAQTFAARDIYGIGDTVHRFRIGLRMGVPWWQAGPRSAGNGAAMRIAPLLLPHLRTPTPALWADVAVAAMITHNDEASTAGCIALAHLLWDCLTAPGPRAAEWWLEEFVRVASPLEGTAVYRSRVRNDAFEGPMTAYLARMRAALEDGRSVREACDSWFSGAYLLETMASVLFILGRHGSDPEEALIRAVNDTRDNDTIASIVGAALGALYGRSALPSRWIAGLTGRTTANDDGRVFQLIDQGLRRFVNPDTPVHHISAS